MSRRNSHVRIGSLLAAVLASSVLLAPSPAQAAGVRAAAASAADERGSWDVVELSTGIFEVTWKSPARLSIGSEPTTWSRPGLTFGPPTIAADGRTVARRDRRVRRRRTPTTSR